MNGMSNSFNSANGARPPVEQTVVLRTGDQVRVWRDFYWHHAVYVAGQHLIEFGSGIWGGRVAWVDFQSFSRRARVELVRSGGISAAMRALGQLGRGGFNILTRNCEHFATWCTTGRFESEQVNGFFEGLFKALIVGAVGLLAVQTA